MDFDRILHQWENRKDGRGASHEDAAAEKPTSESGTQIADWLERFPPNPDAVSEKKEDNPAPVSEGRSVWHKRPHQDILDLHGFNKREAREELARFIRSMRSRGLRKGLIIHGKGLHSDGGSVLIPLVREFLEMSTDVGAFGRATRKNGGSGATWFLLRHRSR